MSGPATLGLLPAVQEATPGNDRIAASR
jgi:hypothetical protein